MTLPLSIFVIACNEADRLPATLRAVQNLTDDLIVVDSGSTDATKDIAARFGARVFANPWPGYGPQKRFAEDRCRHPWLLNLDADEVVTPELAQEIRGLFEDGGPAADGYEVRIAEIFPGEGKPHRFAYALHPVRLYQRDKGRYADNPVHDRVVFDGSVKIKRLRGLVHHFSVRSLGEQAAKLNAYSDQQVETLEKENRRLASFRILTEFPLAFLKAYFGRRHFLRGLYGVASAMNIAYFRWLRVAKHLERRRLANQKDLTNQKDLGIHE